MRSFARYCKSVTYLSLGQTSLKRAIERRVVFKSHRGIDEPRSALWFLFNGTGIWSKQRVGKWDLEKIWAGKMGSRHSSIPSLQILYSIVVDRSFVLSPWRCGFLWYSSLRSISSPSAFTEKHFLNERGRGDEGGYGQVGCLCKYLTIRRSKGTQ